jgi:hypothetical protein
MNATAEPTALRAAENMIVLCAWCPHLHILRLEERPGDLFAFARLADGRIEVHRERGGRHTLLIVSHGICDPCKAQHFGAACENEVGQ